jgi:hypothetical protein
LLFQKKSALIFMELLSLERQKERLYALPFDLKSLLTLVLCVYLTILKFVIFYNRMEIKRITKLL